MDEDIYQFILNPPKIPPLSYRQVSDQYERDKKRFRWVGETGLEDYSRVMNQRTGTDMFQLGTRQSTTKDLSIGIDRAIEATGADELGGDVGAMLGGLVGQEQAGREAGAGLPRMAANMLPVAAAGALAPVSGGSSLLTIPGMLGLAGTAGLTGAQTYTETDSPGAALFSGGVAAATPGIGNMAGKFVGQKLAQSAGTMVGETLGQRAASYGASQAGMGLFGEAAYQGQRVAGGEGLDLSPEHFTQQAIGQLAFLPVDVASLFKGPTPEQVAAHRTAKREAETKAREDASIADASNVISSDVFPQTTEAGSARIETPDTLISPENAIPLGDTQPDYLYWRGRQVIDTGDSRVGQGTNTRQVLVREGKSKFWVNEGEVKPFDPTAERKFVMVGEGQLESTGSRQGRMLPSQEETRALNYGPLAIRPPSEFALSSPRVTPDVVVAARKEIQSISEERDYSKQLKRIHTLYNQLEPLYKVKDVALAKLDDADIRARLGELVDRGVDVNDAAIRVVESLRTSLDQAVQAKAREYGATNKIVTKDRMDEIRAKLAALRGQTNMSIIGVPPEMVPLLFELGVGHAEALVRAGALKIQDWTASVKQDFPDITDAQLRPLWSQVREHLQIGGNDAETRGSVGQRSRVEEATGKLQALDDSWLARQREVPMPSRKEWAELNQNPLLRLNKIRERLLRKHKYLNQYPRVQEDLLVAMSQADLTKTDAEIMGYMRQSADNAHKMSLRQTAGEVDKVLHENVASSSEAYRLAEEVNRGIKADDPQKAEVVELKKGQGPYNVVLRTKSQRSLDDKFTQDVKGARQSAEEDVLAAAEESELVTNKDDDAPITLNDEGEVVDTMADIDKELEQAALELGREASETLESVVDDFWGGLLRKVDWLEFAARGVKNPAVFAERAKVMLEYYRDKRMNIDVKDSGELMRRMAEVGAPFDNEQQLRGWYAPKGQFYENMMGSRGWLAQQPEVLGLLESRRNKSRKGPDLDKISRISPAVRAGNQTWTGFIHADAWSKASEAGHPEAESGYITDTGEFITTKQAHQWARKNGMETGKTTPGELRTDDIGDNDQVYLPLDEKGNLDTSDAKSRPNPLAQPASEGIPDNFNPESVGAGPNRAKVSRQQLDPQYSMMTTPLASTMSAQDFGVRYAQRLGMGPETAKIFGDRLARVAAVFRAADRARVTGLAGTPDWGLALTTVTDPAWKGLIAVSQEAFPVHEADLWQKSLTLGHEAWHIVEQSYARGEMTPNDKLAVEGLKELSTSLDVPQRTELLKSMLYESLPKEMWDKLHNNDDAIMQLQSFLRYSAETPREFMATVAGMYSIGLSEPSKSHGVINRIKDSLTYGDGAVARFMQLVFRTASEFTRAVKAMWTGADLGLVEGQRSVPASEVMDRMETAFRSLARTPDEITKALKTLDLLNRTSPESWAHMLAINRAPTFDETKFGDTVLDAGLQDYRARILPPGDPNDISKVDSYWWNMAQLVEANPKLRPVLVESQSYQALAEDAAEAVVSPFFKRDGSGGHVRIVGPTKELNAVTAHEGMRNAYRDITLNEQELGRFLDDSEKQIIRQKHGLSADQMQDVQSVRNAFKDANTVAAQQLKRFGRMQIEHLVAKTILRNSNGNYNTALKQSQTITEAALAMSGAIPTTPGVDYMAMIASAGVDPTVLPKALGAANVLAPKWKATATVLDSMPWYITEQRYGQYQVSYSKTGEKLRGRESAKTSAEFQKLVERLRGDKSISDIRTFETTQGELAGLNADLVSKFKDLEDANYQAALETLTPEDAQQMRESYTFGSAIDRELAARGLGKYTMHRKFAPGRESIDMLQNSLDYLTTLPFAMAKNWLKERANVTLLDADIQANPSVQRLGRQKFDSMLATSGRLENAVRAGSFYYFLGGNLSSAIVELTQPLQMLPAQLTADGMRASSGYKLIAKAAGAVTRAYGKGTHGSPFIDSMMQRLEASRLVDRGIMSQFFDDSELNYVHLNRFAAGDRSAMSLAQAAAKPIAHLATMWRNLYGLTTSLTTRISAVTALMRAEELVKSGKMTNDDAFNYAVRMVGLTAPGTGGRATQPVGLSSDGKFLNRSAKGMVMALQSYNLAMTSGFLRMARDAVASGSMTTQQSKAFAQLFGTQMLMAGAMGLPGVGVAIGLANQFFPQFEIKRKMRETIAKLGGDDLELGRLYSDLALRGLPTAVGPVDLSGRLGLSSLLGVSSYDGFQASHLLGAPGGIVENLWKGWQTAQQGKFGEGVQQAAPTALKNVLSAFRTQGKVYDKTGNLLYDPSSGEQLAMAVGFTPKRVADVREYARLSGQAEEVARNEQSRFLDNVANLIIEKRTNEARQLLIAREKASPTEFSAMEGLQAAIKRAEDKTMPKDPRRTGSKASSIERQGLLATYGGQINPALSEVARVSQRHQVLQSMGVPANGRDVLEATMMDQLMTQQPNLTRSQAAAMVDQMLGRQRQRLR